MTNEKESFFRYALVFHRTAAQAKKNKERPIDHQLFGFQCNVEFKKNPREVSVPYNIAVTRIPENVTESELRTLFVDCDSLIYFPARSVKKSTRTNPSMHEKKILNGYVSDFDVTLNWFVWERRLLTSPGSNRGLFESFSFLFTISS